MLRNVRRIGFFFFDVFYSRPTGRSRLTTYDNAHFADVCDTRTRACGRRFVLSVAGQRGPCAVVSPGLRKHKKRRTSVRRLRFGYRRESAGRRASTYVFGGCTPREEETRFRPPSQSVVFDRLDQCRR